MRARGRGGAPGARLDGRGPSSGVYVHIFADVSQVYAAWRRRALYSPLVAAFCFLRKQTKRGPPGFGRFGVRGFLGA